MDARRVKTRSSRGFSAADSPGPQGRRRKKHGPRSVRGRLLPPEMPAIADFQAAPVYCRSLRIKGATMATQMTKSQLIEQIATNNELAKKDVKGVMETLAEIGYRELKKNGSSPALPNSSSSRSLPPRPAKAPTPSRARP
jgi:Bacterial DNA-binding protein